MDHAVYVRPKKLHPHRNFNGTWNWNSGEAGIYQFREFTFEVAQYLESETFHAKLFHPVWKTTTIYAPGSLTWEEFLLLCEHTALCVDRLLRAHILQPEEGGNVPQNTHGQT
jgi:hypothetical protein